MYRKIRIIINFPLYLLAMLGNEKDLDQLDQFETMFSALLSKTEGWESMTNDIEIYFRIKHLVIDSFECTLIIMPSIIKAQIEGCMCKLRSAEYFCDYEGLIIFLKFAHVLSEALLSHLDKREIKDFAAPYKVVQALDSVIRPNEEYNKYSGNNLPLMGAAFSLGLLKLKAVVKNTDWKQGWGEGWEEF